MDKILCKYSNKEIIKKKELSYIFVRLNEKCNARCKFCNCWKTKSEQILVKMDYLAKCLIEANPLEVNLSGGEVFISPNLWTLLEKAKSINWSITTNGSGLTVDNVRKLSELNVKRLFISVDSYIYEKNNKSRGIKNLLEQVENAVKFITKEHLSIKTIINHVVTNENYYEIDRFIDYKNEIGVDAINLIPIKDQKDMYLTREQIKDFYKLIEKKIDKNPYKFFLNGRYKIFGESNESFLKAELGRYPNNKNYCIMAYNTVFIDCLSGDVYPCDNTIWRYDKDHYKLGNLLDNTLYEIWNSETIENFRNNMYPNIKYGCYEYCDPNNNIYLFDECV